MLALNDRGREILKQARQYGIFLNAGERAEAPYQDLEIRCGRLYGLFAVDGPESPLAEENRRIYYDKNA